MWPGSAWARATANSVARSVTGDGAHLVLGEPGDAHLLREALHLAGAAVRGVHLGHDGHEGAVGALVALDHVLREEAAGAQFGGCEASGFPRRWRSCARGSRCGCSPRRRTAGRPRRPSRRSRPARRACAAAPACRWRRRRTGAWRACPASGLIRIP